MKNPQFSETQFVISYTRELFKNIKFPFSITAPSTVAERKTASDLIVKYYGKRGHFRFSEFYQFKISKYYNGKTFSSLKGGISIDTSTSPMFGFDVYNSKKTRQFNILQKISQKSRTRVYYCAPLFYKLEDFNTYFFQQRILGHSMVFDFQEPELDNIRIPLGSKHKIIFDKYDQYICSDPIRIKGFIASERLRSGYDDLTDNSFELYVREIYNIVKDELSEKKL